MKLQKPNLSKRSQTVLKHWCSDASAYLLRRSLAAAMLAAAVLGNTSVQAADLSLSYFMGPKHPMNKAVFTPFAEKLSEVSGGKLSVTQFPGGALNSAPPKQYSILLDGVADIAFHLPGYTSQLFPLTNVVTVPGVCDSAMSCTSALLRARPELEKEYNAKVLAIWANQPPVLITRDKPVRSMADLKGMKIRVTSAADVPYTEALGASAVSQPVSVINQNLTNGVIDAIAIDPSAIRSFKLFDAGNYVTTWFPGSGSAFVLLMNKGVYDGLSEEERGWVDAASGDWLSMSGGNTYEKAAAGGLKAAADAGNEIIELPEEEKTKMNAAIAGALEAFNASTVIDGVTGADAVKLFKGE